MEGDGWISISKKPPFLCPILAFFRVSVCKKEARVWERNCLLGLSVSLYFLIPPELLRVSELSKSSLSAAAALIVAGTNANESPPTLMSSPRPPCPG